MTAMDIKKTYDNDLFVNMVNNDKRHIARAKAKARRVKAERDHIEDQKSLRHVGVGVIIGFILYGAIYAVLSILA